MKTILFLLSTYIPTLLFSQQLTNEKVFYHYDKQVNFIHFTSNSNEIITTAGLENDILWNLDNKEIKSILNTFSYGESAMNYDGTEMCTVGGQYYDPEKKESYTASLSFYDVAKNETTTKKFTELDLQRMCYHPTNTNLIGIIGMDEDFNFRAALMDREKFEITTLTFQGKGSLIPLYQQFTPDGKYVIIGYGNSSYNGGISVFDLLTKKEIKRIPLKDQPEEFIFTKEGEIIVRGSKTTFIYTKDWTEKAQYEIHLAAVHPSGKFGIHFNNEKEAYFYSFDSKTKIKLNLPILLRQDFSSVMEFYGYAKFSPDGKKLAIKYFKWHSSKTQTTSEFPAFMVYDLGLE